MKKKTTLFEMAQDWIGIDFRLHGYTKFGCDCIGLVIGILKDNNIIDEKFIKKFKSYRYGNNLKNINEEQVVNDLAFCFDETNDIKNADLLLVETRNSPFHFVIIERNKNLNDCKIIHTTQETGKSFLSSYDYSFKIKKMFKLRI